jgi:hypothetical protein
MANCQGNRREVSFFLAFVMLCMQLVLAQHATVHFIEDEHIGAGSQQEDRQDSPANPPAHDKGKICQICLFSKVLSYTLLVASVDVAKSDFTTMFAVPVRRDANARHEGLPLRARAPPNLLF